MFWFKHHNNFSTNPKIDMLIDNHKLNGFYGLIRMFEYLADHLDIEDPENFVFSKRKFYSEIFPFCCQKTRNKIMDYFQNLGWIKYRIIGKEILIKCKEMKELADDYTKKRLRDKAKKKG